MVSTSFYLSYLSNIICTCSRRFGLKCNLPLVCSFRHIVYKIFISGRETRKAVGFLSISKLVLLLLCAVVFFFYVHGKHLRSCRDGQFT